MRDYRFKAISQEKEWEDNWIEGSLCKSDSKCYIVYDNDFTVGCEQLISDRFFEVNPDTLCEHTGIGDIWEHDILDYSGDRYEVVFENGSYIGKCKDGLNLYLSFMLNDGATKIGNKFDGGVE